MSPALLRKVIIIYIQPILEYCSSVWCPYLRKDIDAIERVLHRASKMSPALRQLPREERLRRLELNQLADRREKNDLIETLKILTHAYNDDDLPNIFVRATARNLRGHDLKIRMGRWNRLPRRHYLANRVVQNWNGLSTTMVNAVSVDAFKEAIN